jgi:microcystin-dependent protein
MDPFVAEIRIFPFNFAPKGWALCDGQIMPLSQNTALFSLLGTTYGGDGKSTFALPDLQGRAPMHPGQGPGLSLHDLGETGGSSTVTLLTTEIPAHNHEIKANAAPASFSGPVTATVGQVTTWSNAGVGNPNAYAPPGALAPMAWNSNPIAGGSLPHNNMMPSLTVNFCIALQGVFPPRS